MKLKGTKRCSKCREVLPIERFAKRKKHKDGLQYDCRNCTRLAYRERRERLVVAYRKKDAEYYKRNKAAIIERRRKYHEENKQKTSARQKVTRAVKSGVLVRPKECSKCGIGCVPDAHHEDYGKPLDVKWLCRRCHLRAHAGDQPRQE